MPVPSQYTSSMTHYIETRKNEEIHTLLPGLLRSAADPRIDAVGRAWIFDALRRLTGSNLADDIATWMEWYANAYGTRVSVSKSHHNLEEFIAACPWLPYGASF